MQVGAIGSLNTLLIPMPRCGGRLAAKWTARRMPIRWKDAQGRSGTSNKCSPSYKDDANCGNEYSVLRADDVIRA